MSKVVRILLMALVAGSVLFVGESAEAAPSISLQQVTAGLSSPVALTHAEDGSGRMFITEQGGRVRIFKQGSLVATPYLDIDSLVLTAGEQGLLSVAFHPSYEVNGYFFVYYTNNSGNNVVARYQASPPSSDTVNSATGQVILTINHPTHTNHNGGQIEFGPDGYLYIGPGDGGGGGDTSNNAQTLSTLLGKILRIDVDSAFPYAIPPGNPFADGGGPNRDEIWHRGLRNPWRFSFDRLTGEMFIGDVGQASWEEISLAPAEVGGLNFGWRLMEGNHCFNPSTNCNPGGLTLPIIEYSSSGTAECSVTGGYVHRGPSPGLNGFYFFGDYCSGKVWAGERGNTPLEPWGAPQLLDTTLNISSFGEDEAGEVYVVHHGGSIHKIVDNAPPPSCPVAGPGSKVVDQILPEGETRYGIGTFILLANSSTTTQAIANITYLTPFGPVCPASAQSVTVDPGQRRTVDVNATLGQVTKVGALVEVYGTAAVAEVSVHRKGSLSNVDVTASVSVSSSWTIPEGASHSGFATEISVVNPNTSSATQVDFTFLRPSGSFSPPAMQNVTVPAGGKIAIDLGSACGCNDDVSTRVMVDGADPGVVAGFSISRAASGDIGFGGSLGLTETRPAWVVPEGATHGGWHTFVLIANPNSGASTVDVNFFTPGGSVPGPQNLSIAAGRRATVDVNVACGCATDVSTLVVADSGTVAVESSIQKEDPAGFVIADSVGSGGDSPVGASGTSWLAAEGATHSGFATFVLIANAGPTNATFDVTFLTSTGSTAPPSLQNIVLPPGSRYTVSVDAFLPAHDVSTRVDADAPVVVETSIDRITGDGFSKGRSLAFRLA